MELEIFEMWGGTFLFLTELVHELQIQFVSPHQDRKASAFSDTISDALRRAHTTSVIAANQLTSCRVAVNSFQHSSLKKWTIKHWVELLDRFADCCSCWTALLIVAALQIKCSAGLCNVEILSMGEEIRDAGWYAKNRGLSNKGADITLLTDEDISIAQIDEIFDGKVNKNGWRYDRKPDQQIVASILELYKRVTGKSKVVNNQLNLTFARGVVAWLKGKTLDWAKYAVFCNKYADDVRQTKAANQELKEQSGGEVQQPCLQKRAGRPPVAGRPPGATSQCGVGNFRIKQEGQSMPTLIAAGFGGPQWQAEETSEVKQLLETLKIALTGAKHEVVQAQEQHATNEAASQVSHMHLEGRKKVFVDSESERLSLERELNLLKMRSLSEGTGPATEADCLQPALPLDMLEAQQKVDWAIKSESVAMSMLKSCTDECNKSSEKADFSLHMLTAKGNRVEELGAQIQCVEQQLEMMSVGAGFSFYPQPVISNPDYVESFSVIQITNFPVCGNGFEFKDILVTSCGHTYHPICLYWHGNTSFTCKLASCLKPFAADWLLSVGMRPLSKSASVPSVTMDQYQRTTWMQKLLGRCSQVLSLPVSHEQQRQSFVNEGCFNVSNMETFNAPGCSVHASNLGSDCQGISPETNSVSRSYSGAFETSANVNNDTGTCLICSINTPDIKLKDCGHSRVCSNCVMQQNPLLCPVCGVEVTGFIRPIVGKVSSPLRPIQQSGVTFGQNSVQSKPPPPIKVDLSAAFDAEIVPENGTKDSTAEHLGDRKPMYLQTTSKKGKETVSNRLELCDSDLEELTNPSLVHYPPLPVMGISAKQPLSGEANSEAELESEGGDGLPAGFPGVTKSMGRSDLTKEGDAGLCIDKPEAQPDVKDSKATNKQHIPATPNLSCGKRVTRADAADTEKTVVVKKKRRKRPPPAVKAFNSFS